MAPTAWIAPYPFWAYPTHLTRPAHAVIFQSADGRTLTRCNRLLFTSPLVVVERADEDGLPDRQKCEHCA